MRTRKLLILFVFAAFTFSACQDNNKQKEQEERERTERMQAEQEAEMRAEEERMARESNSISARLMETDSLSTFANALERGELSQRLTEEEGPFTIFAPSNTAFEGDQTAMDEINNQEDAEDLDAMLEYYVVKDEITTDMLRQQIEDNNGEYNLNTMDGSELTAVMSGEDIVLRDENGNTARIVQADIDASNGVVHVIDAAIRKGGS